MTPASAAEIPKVASQELRLSELAPRALQSEIRAMTMECDRIGGGEPGAGGLRYGAAGAGG